MPRNPFLSPDEPTLADVLARLGDDTELSPTRRRDLCSAVRRLARLLDRDPALLPARIDALRPGLVRLHPARLGISAKTLHNIKSDVLAALRHLEICSDPRGPRSHLAPGWRAFLAALPEVAMRRGLSRLARYCSAAGLAPRDIDDQVMERFMTAIHEASFTKDPEKLRRRVISLWNRARVALPDRTLKTLTMPPSRRQHRSLPLDAFPTSFQKELADHLVWLEGRDPFAENPPPRPCRPSTIEQRRRYLLLAASALVGRGRPAAEIVGLRALVEPEALKEICRHYLGRNHGNGTEFARALCTALIQVARHWLGLEDGRVRELGEIRAKLEPTPEGLTEKNRACLRQFDDPETLARLLTLPAALAAEAVKRDNGSRSGAVTMQAALAIEILLMAPMRIGNLVGLRLDRHIVRPGGPKGPVLIVLGAEEVKNAKSLEYELPPALRELLDLYLTSFRPRLADADNPYLFPGRTVPVKAATTLKQHLCDLIRRRTGIVMTPHQFRHLAAKLTLDANPANFELTRQILGHKRMRTTVGFYAGLNARRAVRHYDAHVLKLRQGLVEDGGDKS